MSNGKVAKPQKSKAFGKPLTASQIKRMEKNKKNLSSSDLDKLNKATKAGGKHEVS